MSKNRFYGCHILYQVLIKRQHLKVAMQSVLPVSIETQDQAWIQHMVYMSLRHYFSLTDRWQQHLHKPLKDQLVAQLLTLSLAQKFYAEVPDHAIVNEAVNCTRQLKKKWAGGLINKVLKLALADTNYQPSTDQARFEHPDWWLATLKKDWPEHWPAIVNANNQQPPLWLRMDSEVIPANSQPHSTLPAAWLITDKKLPISLLTSGQATVQDAAAQWAAHLLAPKDGELILDACAAPGGKSTHLMTLNNNFRLHILEQDSQRMQLIKDNLKRLQLTPDRLIVGDASKPETWYQNEKYDKILVDVPCSASGVVRRHPDIKLLRQANDMILLTQLQQQILTACASLLKSGGRLLYATCSVFQAENERQIHRFLKQHSNFSEVSLIVPDSVSCRHGLQILPGQGQMDGFYYCLLEKQ